MADRRIDILLVEDNIDDAAFLMHALKESAMDVELRSARDGVKALEMIFGEADATAAAPILWPRLILLDLKLPRLGGLEVLGRLKSNPHARPIPVVVLSSSLEGHDLEQSYLAGANSYLVKPMDFAAFAEQVKILATYWLRINQMPHS